MIPSCQRLHHQICCDLHANRGVRVAIARKISTGDQASPLRVDLKNASRPDNQDGLPVLGGQIVQDAIMQYPGFGAVGCGARTITVDLLPQNHPSQLATG